MAESFQRRIRNLIANFRGIPGERSRAREKPLRSIDALLERFVQNASHRSEKLTLLRDFWPQIVGGTLAKFCQPLRIFGKKIVIQAANATVKQELLLSQKLILERARRLPFLGEISQIQVSF